METQLTIPETLKDLAQQLSDKSITPIRLAEVFAATKRLAAMLEKVDDVAREKVLDLLKAQGEKYTDAGSLRLTAGEYRLEAQPQGTGYDDKKVEALLRAKKLDPTAGMDATITYKTNVEKLEAALSVDEQKMCKKDLKYRVLSPKKVEENNE